jgi:hypothetical protein
MPQYKIIEVNRENKELIQRVAKQKGFPIDDSNQFFCLIQTVGDAQLVGVLGFNSDSGANYHKIGGNDYTEEHEIIYTFDESYISVPITDELLTQICSWLYRYLLKSALLSAPVIGDKSKLFNYGVNNTGSVKYLSDAFKLMDCESFECQLEILGYQNKNI